MNDSVRVLLIDESVERSVTLSRVLKECGYEDVTVCSPDDPIMDRVIDINPQIILIDVLSSPDDDTQTIESALKCGVTAYISSEITSKQAKPIIDTAMLTFASFQNLKNKLGEVKEKLEHQKVIQKAKGILMSDYNLTEDIAYQKLRRFAMNQKRSMADVAHQIIEVKKLTS